MALLNFQLPPSLKDFCVRTLDFLLWQAEQATDAFFFDNGKLSVGVGGSEEFNDGMGAKRGGGRDPEAIELHQQQTHIVGTLHGH
ncbi:hypothetical protein H2198_009508 [Neophaeococcomyces mojaviensis]|uniref:Uncharacterized protein n=1 Tax=Neophaeococcomyces mojaviensis TaxID=3383035 RepID=A0ACC2ZUD2_9EURO|nr:hypothetical protein H2198_009508 [Knufia sp. JES_112]